MVFMHQFENMCHSNMQWYVIIVSKSVYYGSNVFYFYIFLGLLASDRPAEEEKIQNFVAIASFLPDPNWLAPIFEKFGVYRLTFFSLSWIPVGIIVYICRYIQSACKDHKMKKRNDKQAHAAFYTRLCIVCPELLICAILIIGAIDPQGNFQLIGYFTFRFNNSIVQYTKCFTDLIVVLYCIDVYNAFTASKTMKSNTPFAEKYKYGLPILITFGIFMVSSANKTTISTIP